MVIENFGTPDPGSPNNQDELSTPSPNTIQVQHNDTDTEDEENMYNGYEPLPTNDTGINDVDSDDSISPADNSEETSTPTNDLPPIVPIENDLVKEVWSAPAPKEVDIEMDANRVQQVKQVMQNIVLPSTSIPEWATSIPEDEWKQQLMERLRNLNGK